MERGVAVWFGVFSAAGFVLRGHLRQIAPVGVLRLVFADVSLRLSQQSGDVTILYLVHLSITSSGQRST